jgi:quinohemoprotein ethanol dehydrogenase
VAHSWKVPNLSRVLVYKLGGTHQLPPLAQPDRVLPKPAAVTADAATIEQGQIVFQRHCSYCHGDGLRTGGVTPDLRWSTENVHSMWQDIVIDGALASRGMVGFGEHVSPADAEAIRQYVLSEANRLYAEQNPDKKD